jgi:hypothetical protein
MKNETTNTNEIINAFCDCCGNQESGAKAELVNLGWFLGSSEQFCPECND